MSEEYLEDFDENENKQVFLKLVKQFRLTVQKIDAFTCRVVADSIEYYSIDEVEKEDQHMVIIEVEGGIVTKIAADIAFEKNIAFFVVNRDDNEAEEITPVKLEKMVREVTNAVKLYEGDALICDQCETDYNFSNSDSRTRSSKIAYCSEVCDNRANRL